MLSTDSTSIAPYAWPEEDQLLIKAAYRRLLRAIRNANITVEEKQEIRRGHLSWLLPPMGTKDENPENHILPIPLK
jgi:hypothetical protein